VKILNIKQASTIDSALHLITTHRNNAFKLVNLLGFSEMELLDIIDLAYSFHPLLNNSFPLMGQRLRPVPGISQRRIALKNSGDRF
jgi:hypothetical protein